MVLFQSPEGSNSMEFMETSELNRNLEESFSRPKALTQWNNNLVKGKKLSIVRFSRPKALTQWNILRDTIFHVEYESFSRPKALTQWNLIIFRAYEYTLSSFQSPEGSNSMELLKDGKRG